MTRLRTAAALALLASLGAACQRAARDPAETVRALYTYHFAHDKGFTPAGVDERARWLTPDLAAQCRAWFAKPSPPDEVPSIDGDPFTDSQEYPDTFVVGTPTLRGDTALVPVAMRWSSGDRRVVTNVLHRVEGAWRVDDLRYEAGESLRALLKE